MGEKLEDGLTKFMKLSVEEQISVLYEILKLTMLGTLVANLTSIEASANSGKMRMSKDISKCDEVVLINQSITGIYENKVNLLTI